MCALSVFLQENPFREILSGRIEDPLSSVYYAIKIRSLFPISLQRMKYSSNSTTIGLEEDETRTGN
jgi:hypothetical protein